MGRLSYDRRIALHHPQHDPILINQLRKMQQVYLEQKRAESLRDLQLSANEKAHPNGRTDNVQTLTSRSLLGRRRPDPRRDLDDECGYPEQSQMSAWFWWELHLCEPLAGRVNEFMPKQSWQVRPEIYEMERGQVETAFEEGVEQLGRQSYGDGIEDYYISEQGGTKINETLMRADVLSGVSQYGIIIIGLNDGRRLSEPVAGVYEQNSASYVQSEKAKKPRIVGNSKKQYKLAINQDEISKGYEGQGSRKLNWLCALPEHLAPVSRWEINKSSPRWAQPTLYRVTINDPMSYMISGIGMPMGTYDVHWSRVIHIADTDHTAGVNDWLAIPRCRPMLRPILDAAKTRGASGEGYWKAAFSYLFFSTHPQLGGDVEIEEEEMQDLYENLINGLQRSATVKGLQPMLLGPQANDPRGFRETYIEDICIKGGWPIRVFKGSERGELASSQDDAAWNDEVRRREHGYNSCNLVARLYNRFIMLGLLPKPAAEKVENMLRNYRRKNLLRRAPGGWIALNDVGTPKAGKPELYINQAGYKIWWPDLASQTDSEKATVAFTQTQAMAQYVSGNVSSLMAPYDFLTRILPFTDEEAEAILSEAAYEAGEGGEEIVEGPGAEPSAEAGTPPPNQPEPTPEDEGSAPTL